MTKKRSSDFLVKKKVHPEKIMAVPMCCITVGICSNELCDYTGRYGLCVGGR